MILATRTYTITILKQQNLCLFPKHYCKKYPANHGVGQHAINFKGFNGVLCLKLNMSCLNKGKPSRMILATRTYTITILKQQNLCLFPKHYCKKYPANHGQHAINFKGFNGVLCLKLNMSCLNKGKPSV